MLAARLFHAMLQLGVHDAVWWLLRCHTVSHDFPSMLERVEQLSVPVVLLGAASPVASWGVWQAASHTQSQRQKGDVHGC